jgi:hypothetical protein
MARYRRFHGTGIGLITAVTRSNVTGHCSVSL